MRHILFILIATFTVYNASANFGSHGLVNSKSVLMGNGGSAYSDGIYNVHLNPASIISSSDSSYFQFFFPGLDLNAQAYTNALPIDDFNYFFGGVDDGMGNTIGRTLTSADKDRLISNFEDGGQIGVNTNINWFSMGLYANDKIGAFALSISDHINYNMTLPQSLMELLIKSNQPGRTYNFDDFTLSASWIRSYGLTYSRKIITNGEGLFKHINGGLTLKYYQGMGFTEMTMENTSFFTHVNDHQLDIAYTLIQNNAYSSGASGFFNEDEEEGNFSPFESAGSGIGFDLGFSAELDMGLVIAASITDAGSFNWDVNAEERIISSSTSISDLTEEEQLDSLLESGDPVTRSLSQIEGQLPTALRIGFWLPVHKVAAVPGELNLTLDFNQGFNDYAANSTISKISVGVDWKPFKYWPKLLTGFSNDRIGGTRWSMGLGYSPSFMDIYIGTHDLISAFSPNDHASVAFGIRWKILN